MKRKYYWSAVAFCLLFASSALASNCKREEALSGQAAVTTSTNKAPASRAAKSKVTKIVFVGKLAACDCTRRRIDDSWAALQAALGTSGDIQIERLHVDTEQTKVAPYRKMRAIMVIPAAYFLDASGALLDMLQGEITTEQFGKALR